MDAQQVQNLIQASIPNAKVTVSGGEGNAASGTYASVGGGRNRTASGQYDWRAGGPSQDP